MRKTSIGFVVALLVALSVAGLMLAVNHQWPRQVLVAETSTPRATVQHALRDVRRADFDRLRKHLLPPDAAAAVLESWGTLDDHVRVHATASERARFAAFMRELTVPDAEQQLFARARPVLDDWDHDGKRRLPMVVAVVRLLVGASITRAHGLDAGQKRELRDLVEVLAGWVSNTDWGDKVRARKAIDIAVATARKLDIKSLDDAYALTYARAMSRYAILWNGLRRGLSVYGLSVDEILDSATVQVTSQDADKATVQVHYQVLGHGETATFDMAREGERWYPAQILAWWQAHNVTAAQMAPAPAAAGSSLPAAASSAR